MVNILSILIYIYIQSFNIVLSWACISTWDVVILLIHTKCTLTKAFSLLTITLIIHIIIDKIHICLIYIFLNTDNNYKFTSKNYKLS